jgi:hypothetical protein
MSPTFAHLWGSSPITQSTTQSLMKRKFVGANGMSITIDVEEQKGKESILMLHRLDGGRALLQLIKDGDKEIEKIRKEGCEEMKL